MNNIKFLHNHLDQVLLKLLILQEMQFLNFIRREVILFIFLMKSERFYEILILRKVLLKLLNAHKINLL